MIKGCVFDFGGVMTTMTMPERVRPIVRELGIPWSAIEAGFAKYRRQMDGDLISMEEMYDRTFADAGISITPEDRARIVEADQASYLYRNEETLSFMKDLKARGFKIGILTNMCTGFARLFRIHFPDFIAVADAMVISGEEHLYKPQPEIYDLVERRIGLPANELCFFDDAESNCRGAEESGWQAIRFSTTAKAVAGFERLIAQ